MSTILTAAEVAARFRVRPRCVYGLIRTGALQAVRVGRALRVTEDAVAAFVAAGGRPSADAPARQAVSA